MKQRKALLPKNTLEVIIAVIGLVLIIGAGNKLYANYSSNEEIESAQNTIDVIKAKIDSLEKDQSAETTLRGIDSEKEWYLTGWGKGDTERPNKCFLNSCICICKAGSSSLAENCQNNEGFCREIQEEKVLVELPFLLEIRGPSAGQYSLGQIEGYRECSGKSISLPPKQIKIEFQKTRDALKIKHNTESYLIDKENALKNNLEIINCGDEKRLLELSRS